MKTRMGIAGIVLLAAGTSALPQDRDYSKVEVTSQKVAEGVYMLQGAGGNIGLSVGDDAAFLIDDQYAPRQARPGARRVACGRCRRAPCASSVPILRRSDSGSPSAPASTR
jgi:hypothetical protein